MDIISTSIILTIPKSSTSNAFSTTWEVYKDTSICKFLFYIFLLLAGKPTIIEAGKCSIYIYFYKVKILLF